MLLLLFQPNPWLGVAKNATVLNIVAQYAILVLLIAKIYIPFA